MLDLSAYSHRVSTHQLYRLADWIVREDALLYLESVVLHDPDEEVYEPNVEFRRAHEAVEAAVNLRKATRDWQVCRAHCQLPVRGK